MTKQELLDMKLHEIKNVNPRFIILRVFGGWMYIYLEKAIFVPEELNVYTKEI